MHHMRSNCGKEKSERILGRDTKIVQVWKTNLPLAAYTGDWLVSWLCKELLFSRGRRFFSSPKHPDWLWGPPASCSVGMRSTSPGAKLPECQPDFLPLSSAKVKNEWSCTITPHTPLWYTQGHFYPYQYTEWCTVGNFYVWLLKSWM